MHQIPTAVPSVNPSEKCDHLMNRVLEEPSYGWKDMQGGLIIPTSRQIFKEFLLILDIPATSRNRFKFP